VSPARLPIDEVLPELVAALAQHASAIVRAPTGAGKTTRVPPALLDAGLAGELAIVMLEPRRLAARAAARRMAAERGVPLGSEVGYHVRFDRRAGSATRILVVTEGLLVRMLQEDPYLERFGAVVFDEFHERSLDTDLALAMVRELQREARPELRLVVMSATLAPEPLARWLGGAPVPVPVIDSPGRLHPIEVSYLSRAERASVHALAAAGAARALERSTGDVLVFLPGVGEIRRTREELEALAARRDLALVELYGDLPAEEQDAALSSGPRRKVVLATNVAETSVTVEGVTAVVDTGLARTLRFDPSVALDRLELGRISRSSADQRAGRAGRTAPGICLRLWTEAEQRSLAEADEPEIRRVDLADALLKLACWGVADPRAFAWFEPPPEAALARALELDRSLGALDARGATRAGRAMANLPVHPRLARLLLESERLGHAGRLALVAALLSERGPLRRPRERARARHESESDVLDRVRALESFERTGRTGSEAGELDTGAARAVLQSRDQLLALLGPSGPFGPIGPIGPIGNGRRARFAIALESDEAVLRAVLAAYPDRVAKRREPGSRRGVLASGRGVVLADASAVTDAEWFVCVELEAGARGERAEALVRQASSIRPEWLAPEAFEVGLEVGFDPERERVTAVRRRRLAQIVVDEAQVALPDDGSVSAMLAEAAGAKLDRALALDAPEVRAFLERVRSLRAWRPELELSAFDDDELRALLPELTAGKSSFEELRRAPLVESLRARLTHAQRAALEREVPERIEVPSGSRIALRYEAGRPPVLAVRIQELFGLAQTPRIAGGRVSVLLHLLAPSGRPQQVTEDLASFWDNTYPDVRRELKRRYPKHAWPEDPRRAPPERRPRRR